MHHQKACNGEIKNVNEILKTIYKEHSIDNMDFKPTAQKRDVSRRNVSYLMLKLNNTGQLMS